MNKFLGLKSIPTNKELFKKGFIEKSLSLKDRDKAWRENQLKKEVRDWKRSYDRLYGRYKRLLTFVKRHGWFEGGK